MPRRVSAWRGVVAAVLGILVVFLGPGVTEPVHQSLGAAASQPAQELQLEQPASHHGTPMGPVARVHPGQAGQAGQPNGLLTVPAVVYTPLTGTGDPDEHGSAPPLVWPVAGHTLSLPDLAAAGVVQPAGLDLPTSVGPDAPRDRAPPSTPSA